MTSRDVYDANAESVALNQQRFLAKVKIEIETSEQRKKRLIPGPATLCVAVAAQVY